MTILTSNQVTKRFGGLTAVNSFDFEVPEGSIVSIIGPNGAGKTTFFNCVTGFYTFDEGQIMFDGHMLNGRSPDRIRPQSPEPQATLFSPRMLVVHTMSNSVFQAAAEQQVLIIQPSK